MIKLIVFDLDGVLCDTPIAHYHALNEAIEAIAGKQFCISYDEHIKLYNGKPTKIKLQMLEENKGLNMTHFSNIQKLKQKNTAHKLAELIKKSDKLIDIFTRLRALGYKTHVASNSIRETVEICLKMLGIYDLVDYCISNEDVNHPKPNPEMYLRCMIKEGVGAKETLIIEDSYFGRQAVNLSGAFLCPVNNPDDLTYEVIMNSIEGNVNVIKWKDNKLNILVPMAGAGKRFVDAGYTFPKPLIDVSGKPMIQVVIECLNIEANYIFIVQKEHILKYNIDSTLKLIAPNCKVIGIEGITEGAACTTLLAKEYINNDNQLFIVNSDQWIDWDSSAFMFAMQPSYISGGILTFRNTHPKWSYAKIDENGWIAEIAEKVPISDIATVGAYHWKKGSDYVKYAEQMISKNITVNNEFYTAPVYNEAIKDGLKFKTWDVKEMKGLGTPEDLKAFLEKNK